MQETSLASMSTYCTPFPERPRGYCHVASWTLPFAHAEIGFRTASSMLVPRDFRNVAFSLSTILAFCLPLFHSFQKMSIGTPQSSFACAWSTPIAFVRTREVQIATSVEQEPDQISCIVYRVVSNPAKRCTAHAP